MRGEITRFLDHLQAEKGFSPNTLAAYQNDLSQLLSSLQDRTQHMVAPLPEPNLWNGVRNEHIQVYISTLHSKKYAQTTIARKIASIKSFFHFLHDEKLISGNPAESLSSPGIRRSLPRTISSGEVAELLEQTLKRETPEARRDWAMLSLLCSTGMRVTELVKLNVDDVILDQNLPHIRCIGRNTRARLIRLPEESIGAISEYLTSARDRLARSAEKTALFLNRRGERLTRQGFWLILKSYARAAHLPAEITPHMLRHTFAAHMLGSGRLNLRELQEFLGHASITTTQVYTQISGDFSISGAARKPARSGRR